MLNSLLLNLCTKKQIEYFLDKPGHALLLVGSPGSGKKTIAKTIASETLRINTGSALETYPFYYHLTPTDKSEITIEQVRKLIYNFRLRTPGSNKIRRVVFIENANLMSNEAQNAILKILEEPSSESLFILTAPSELSLLPTVSSRAQIIYVRQVSLNDSRQYFINNYSQSDIEASWILSQGSPGLMSALLQNDSQHSLKQAVEKVKKILNQNKYQRLQSLESITKDKPQLSLLLEAFNKILIALHHKAVQAENMVDAERMLSNRRLINQLQQALEQNVAPKLINLKLVANLRL
ncbi:AAA family ATPase [Candidatus Saccharibacteria bacterium]|nr:AAA family ATPase [Candidatus Saccharibacteria bacterium]